MYRRKPAPLTPGEARKRLRDNKITQKEVARQLNLSESHVSKVLDNIDMNQKIWDYILSLPCEKAA